MVLGFFTRIIDDDQMCHELMYEMMQFSYIETDSRGSAPEALDSYACFTVMMTISRSWTSYMPDQKRVSAFRKDYGGRATMSQSSQ